MRLKSFLNFHINIHHLVGNILIIGAVILTGFTYFPILLIYLQPATPVQAISQTGLFLSIPKINAQAPIIINVNPWKQSEYFPALQKGIALASGSVLPGQKGTMYLFAHSSDLPWRMTRTNTAFLRLGELQTGDPLFIFNQCTKYQYQVIDKKEVWPEEVQYLTDFKEDQVILQTCTPIGTALKRLLVFAKLV